MVVDASVVVRWFVEQPGHERAKAWMARFIDDDQSLVGPDLLSFEVFGALCRLQPARSPDWAAQSHAHFTELGMRLLPTEPAIFERAAVLSRTLKIAGYDALYLAHAEQLGVPWLTADARVLRRLAGDARARAL